MELTKTWSILGGTRPSSYSSNPRLITFINLSKDIFSSPINSTIWSRISTTICQTCEYSSAISKSPFSLKLLMRFSKVSSILISNKNSYTYVQISLTVLFCFFSLSCNLIIGSKTLFFVSLILSFCSKSNSLSSAK